MDLEPRNAAAFAGYAQATMVLAQQGLSMDIGEAGRLGRRLDLGAARLARILAVRAVVDHQLEALGRGLGQVGGGNLRGDRELVGDASEVSHLQYR